MIGKDGARLAGRFSQRIRVDQILETLEKLKVYDKGVILDDAQEHVYQRHVGYRTGDMWAPRLDNIEALAVETQHFADCVRTGETPLSDGRAGLRVVRILEAAHESMAQRGLPIEIPPMREVMA